MQKELKVGRNEHDITKYHLLSKLNKWRALDVHNPVAIAGHVSTDVLNSRLSRVKVHALCTCFTTA